MDEYDDLDGYPKGSYAVVTGSVITGFKLHGPFSSMKEAVQWALKREPLIGKVSILPIEPPELNSVKEAP